MATILCIPKHQLWDPQHTQRTYVYFFEGTSLCLSTLYQIFNSWDPNWRGFIGTNLIVIYEEFGHLISEDVQLLILESMRNNTIGDSYRVGGVDDDVLYPSYSNPALMSAIATGWTGRLLNDSNMTAAGELYARQILDLFDRNDTLSEFNSPTYAGVGLYALTMWASICLNRLSWARTVGV